MRLPASFLTFGSIVTATSTVEEARTQFETFKVTFKKTYAAEEEGAKFEAFQASLARVEAGNADRRARGADETQGITQFSDLTPAEFRKTYLTLKPRSPERIAATPALSKDDCAACGLFPEHTNATFTGGFDWVTKGAVTKVKDQGQCGSCWSFGTTGDIEGTTFLKTGKLNSLSEQQLVSCDTASDQGCNGGLQEDAFVYVEKNGLTSEANYPYTSGAGRTGVCRKAKIVAPLTKISSWKQVSKTPQGEADLKDALTKNGPITIGIDATPMQDYKGGVDNPVNCNAKRGCGCTADDLDHAVLIVGYGMGEYKNGTATAYWKIKNSWATSWGEEGYYRVAAGHNKCGLAMDAVHSVV